jgi:4-hydroxy-tetrahydrodipicolinate synthase
VSAQAVFEGVGVALVTIFDDRGDLDAGATAELARQLVSLGVRAVVVAGTTGEAAALDPDERATLLAAVRQAVPAVPLIVGTGAPSARQAVRYTVQARDGGADAVLALSPPGASDVRPYYEAVARAAGELPLLAYHFPRVSSPGVPLDALAGLPVAGMKDSSGDPGRLLETLRRWPKPLYPGSTALVSMAALVGCPGVVLGLANAEPEMCVKAFAGDAEAQLAMADVRRAEERFPKGIKELVSARFGFSPSSRLG